MMMMMSRVRRARNTMDRVLGIMPRAELEQLAAGFEIDGKGMDRFDIIELLRKVDDRVAVARSIGRAVTRVVEAGK